MAKNLLFGTLDHSKMHLRDFWMIQHVPYHGRIVKNSYYNQNMQFEVHPTDQSQDIDPNLHGSFKNFYVCYGKLR